MLSNTFGLVKRFLSISVSDKDKDDFIKEINRINKTRVQYTILAFIVMEIMMIFISFIMKKTDFLKNENIYYFGMYVLMIFSMICFYLVLRKLDKSTSAKKTGFRLFGIAFSFYALIWAAFISLMDQWQYGQIIVYTIAVIAVAVVPLYKPNELLLIYIVVQFIFLFLLPYFQKSNEVFFGHILNSTAFIVMAWMISVIRYRKHVEDFNTRKLLKEKTLELNLLNQELEKLSRTDSLSGVYNRFMFDKVLETEWNICRQNHIALSLIIIDIDFFKEINDNYGHQFGDYCLRQVASVLNSCTGHTQGIVARYGGDEFAILISGFNHEQASEFAEQLRNEVEQQKMPHMYSMISDFITISLGVCNLIPADNFSIDEFIRFADNALYQAKKERNNTVIASPVPIQI